MVPLPTHPQHTLNHFNHWLNAAGYLSIVPDHMHFFLANLLSYYAGSVDYNVPYQVHIVLNCFHEHENEFNVHSLARYQTEYLSGYQVTTDKPQIISLI